MAKMLIALGIGVFVSIGCGGGGGNPLQNKGIPVPSASNPSPTPSPTPTPPPTLPPPTPPPAPMITLLGQGQGVRIDASTGVVGWTSGGTARTSAGDSFVGTLVELAGGNALTLVDNVDASAEAYVDGIPAATVPQNPSVIALSNGKVVQAPSGALEISPDGSAYVDGDCSVWFEGTQVAPPDPSGCPMGLKVLPGSNGYAYVGWCDGVGVTVAEVGQAHLALIPVVSGEIGVYGFDFALTSENFVVVAWVQELPGEDGSSVWFQSPGAPKVRLSSPVKAGFSGAGNPVVLDALGNVAFLDDINGSAPGHFDVFEGQVIAAGVPTTIADISNMDDSIDELVGAAGASYGGRIAFGDGSNVWAYGMIP